MRLSVRDVLADAKPQAVLVFDRTPCDDTRCQPYFEENKPLAILTAADGSPTRKSTMSFAVDTMDDRTLVLRLENHAHLGTAFEPKTKKSGYELRFIGSVNNDRRKQAITRFGVVGVGRAWGSRSNEIRLDQYPWMHGIACELVSGEAPQDLIPPYNVLHYNPTGT